MMEKLTCSICSVKKGAGFVSYIAIVKRIDAERIGILPGDGILLKFENKIFPTTLAKRTTSKSFFYAFSIPVEIGKALNKTAEFCLVKKSYTTSKQKSNLFDILSAIPRKTIRGSPMFAFDLNSNVLLWIGNRGNKEITLPRYLDTKKENLMFEILGAYFCEGRRARKSDKHHLDVFSFANSEPSEIKWFSDTMQKVFGIKKCSWNIQILHPSSSTSLKKYWCGMGFDAYKIKLYKNDSVKSDKGVAILQIYGTTISEVFQSLLEFSKLSVLKSKEKSLYFFRGITHGDIGVMHNKGRMSAISFTAATESDAEFFHSLCKVLGIKTSKTYYTEGKKGYWSIFITGYDNFKRLAEMNAFAHKRRATEFSEGFLKNRKSSIYRYLSTINNGAKTSRDIAEKANVSIITARATCKTLRNLKYIKVTQTKHPNPLQHELTEKGLSLLKFYDEVNERL